MNSSQFRVSIKSPQDISANVISAWIELEARAVEANAYLSPLFILPAIKYLDPDANIFIVLVEKNEAGSSDLLGVGVFRKCIASRQFPLPHLVAYKSIHSYLSGLLVDKEYVDEVLNLLFEFISSSKNSWHGLMYESKVADDKLDKMEHAAAARYGAKWHEIKRSKRAILAPSECDETFLLNSPKKIRKDHERRMRRLEEIGKIEWQLLGSDRINEKTIANFIRLEDMGWKGQTGTSLASNSSHVSFFQEMTKGFYEHGRAFFTELSVNNEVIASTSNLISGATGFAFKIGWNVEYAKLSPGVLNEIIFVQRCKEEFSELDFIDSGAGEDSYINSIWPSRRELVSGIYTTTKIGNVVVKNMRRIIEFIKSKKSGTKLQKS